MYKYETHMHTSEASACAHSTGAEMADKYKEEGYAGIIVTDHFFNGNSAVPGELTWDERIRRFCLGFENAEKRGKEIGLDVFFGFEFGDGGSDFLVYGLDKQWLIENEDIHKMEPVRFLEYARSCGGMIIQAHPFRDYEYIKGTLHAPHLVDGIEIINSSHFDPVFNERAKIYAGWYDLPGTSGSDAHNTGDRWYGGGILCEDKLSSVQDYISAVLERSIVCIDN